LAIFSAIEKIPTFEKSLDIFAIEFAIEGHPSYIKREIPAGVHFSKYFFISEKSSLNFLYSFGRKIISAIQEKIDKEKIMKTCSKFKCIEPENIKNANIPLISAGSVFKETK